ncbi:MAG: hypothetical protein LLF28_04155 [Nitrospiraceae bacterium]|nr:hypothetical protein [Nitrospiraceae bacterium]
MRLGVILLILTVIFFSGISISDAQQQGSDALVIREMAALDKAFKTTIDAIVFNKPEIIAPAYEEVHKIREEVETRLKSGQQITLSKNQNQFKRFVRLDNQFHRETEILVNASKKKNMITVQQQMQKMLKLCIKCHSVFRK